MKAIRVEHKDGYGMFVDMINRLDRKHAVKFILINLLKRHHNKFPTPNEEGYYINKKEFCAYKNMEQIQKWIKPREFKTLVTNNYKIYMLDLSKAIELEQQVIYKKEDIIDKTDITELFL